MEPISDVIKKLHSIVTVLRFASMKNVDGDCLTHLVFGMQRKRCYCASKKLVREYMSTVYSLFSTSGSRLAAIMDVPNLHRFSS